MRKGDWVKYRATWTKDKEIRLAEIVDMGTPLHVMLYITNDGYAITDDMIIERRPGGGA